MQALKELRFICRGTATSAHLSPALLELHFNKIFEPVKKLIVDLEINCSSIDTQQGGMIVTLKNDQPFNFEDATTVYKKLNEFYRVVSFKHEADSLDNDIPHATYIFYPKDTK